MSKEKNLLKNTLIDLYSKQKLPTGTIAKLLSCKSHVTILNYLKKYNIPRRSKLGNRISIQISREILFDLYHKEKLTQKQIAKNFGNRSDTGIRRLMRTYGIKTKSDSESHIKYPKFDFSGDLKEKAYLIGFRLGDLNIHKVHELIQARCSSTITEQASLFRDIFNNYGHVSITTAKRGTLEMVILLNMSFNFLLPKKDLIEDWILQNNSYFLPFLAGYADAEGSYYLRTPYYKNKKTPWGVFEIQTYDKNIIYTIFKYLVDIGIECTFSVNTQRLRYKQDMCRLTIVKKQSLWDFIKLIEPYHQHKNKIKDLQKVKENLILRNSIPYCRPITL